MLPPNWASTYDELCDQFTWTLPARFNMAQATCGPAHRDRIALIYDNGSAVHRYTFREMDAASSRLANALRGLGVHAGDRVSIFLPQSPEVPQVHLAAWKLGAISMPLTTLFGPDALAQRLGDGAPAAIVCRDDDLERTAQIAGRLERPPYLIVVGGSGPLPPGAARYEELVGAGSEDVVPADTRGDDPAFLSFTSGTTGPAKGALHAHRSLLGHIPGFQLSHSLFPQPDDLSWTPADWAWMGGFMDVLFPSWYFGVAVLAVAGQFDPERAWRICAEHGVRNTFLPPTAVRMMRQAWTPEVGRDVRLRSVASGGEALGADTLAWARDGLGVTINEFYGQTEVNLVLGNCERLFEPVPGSMGRAYAGHRVAVVDDDGTRVAAGESGEIVISSDDPTAFLGYWNRPDATAQKVQDGWIRTGDLGVQDEHGFFWYHSRTDDIISSAGYRIGPSEIEECVQSHPAVRLAAAIGSPDAVRGEVVKAYVELRPGRTPSDALADEIQKHVRHQLAAYLYPRKIEFVDAIPLTSTGKVRRSELRRMDRERSTADEAAAAGKMG